MFCRKKGVNNPVPLTTKRFYGSVELDATRVGRDAGQIAEEVIEQLRNIENGVFEGYVSIITVMELLSSPRISEQRYEAIRNLLEAFEHIPVDKKVATIAVSCYQRTVPHMA